MSPLRPHRKDTAKRLDQRSNPSAASPPRLTIFQHVLYVPEQRDNVKCFCLYGYISVSPSNRQTPVSQLGPFARFSPENSCRSEEHTSELQSLMRISSAVFCLNK